MPGERFHTTGQGSEYVMPMDESRRQQVHGKLRPLNPTLRERIGEIAAGARAAGEPPHWLGVLIVAAGIGVIVGVVALIREIM